MSVIMARIMLERFRTQGDLASNAIIIFVLLVLEIPIQVA